MWMFGTKRFLKLRAFFWYQTFKYSLSLKTSNNFLIFLGYSYPSYGYSSYSSYPSYGYSSYPSYGGHSGYGGYSGTI
jgi:hypothetical protein